MYERPRSISNFGRPVRLLDEDPGLYEAVPANQRSRALQACIAGSMQIRRGSWEPSEVLVEPGSIGLLVLSGLLLRQVGIDGRFGAELLGPGDLAHPWGRDEAEPGMPSTVRWRALEGTWIAVLTPAVVERLSRFPTLTGALTAKALERTRRLSVMMAIVHHPRVETRVRMLFWHLADRWGRVRSNGVHIPLRLSHSVLADMIAAQRPSVTGALGVLRAEGIVLPTDDGWLLCGDPPGELLELRSIDVG